MLMEVSTNFSRICTELCCGRGTIFDIIVINDTTSFSGALKGKLLRSPFPQNLVTSGPQRPMLWANVVLQPCFLNIVWWQVTGDRHPSPVFFLGTLTYLKAMSKNNNSSLFYTVMDSILLKMLVSLNTLHKHSTLAELEEKTSNYQVLSFRCPCTTLVLANSSIAQC